MATNITTGKDFNYRVHSSDSQKYVGFNTRWEAVAHAAKKSKEGNQVDILTHDKTNGYVKDTTAHEQLAERTKGKVVNANLEAAKNALGELSALAKNAKSAIGKESNLEDLLAAMSSKYEECRSLLDF